MRFSLFNADWDVTRKLAVGSVLVNVVLSAVIMVQSVTISSKSTETFIVPPTIDQVYQIQNDTANIEYYQSMANYFAGVIGSTTSKNVQQTIKTLDQFLPPALQRQMAESLNALASGLPKENFSAWFIAKNTFYEPQTQKIFIQGTLHSSMIGSRVMEQPVIYEFIIKMVAGKPMITHFNSYDGTKPRTLAQIRSQEANNERLAKK